RGCQRDRADRVFVQLIRHECPPDITIERSEKDRSDLFLLVGIRHGVAYLRAKKISTAASAAPRIGDTGTNGLLRREDEDAAAAGSILGGGRQVEVVLGKPDADRMGAVRCRDLLYLRPRLDVDDPQHRAAERATG